MSGTSLLNRASRLAIVAATASLALAACNQNPGAPASNAAAGNEALLSNETAPAPLAAIPLDTSATAPAIAPAPQTASLPPAPPASVGHVADRTQAYAYADQAAAMNTGFGDAPPDYAFDYGGGQRPWVWRADDHSTRIAETLPGGGIRYYYYAAGATAPYLVREPDYSYGYNNGVLVAVYGPGGRLVTVDLMRQRADMAGRILARARAMREAAEQRRREAVAQANWMQHRERFYQEREAWARNRQNDADWRAYHEANHDRDEAAWAAERYRRSIEAARFAQRIHDRQAEQRALEAARRAALAGNRTPPGYASPGGPGGPPPPRFIPPGPGPLPPAGPPHRGPGWPQPPGTASPGGPGGPPPPRFVPPAPGPMPPTGQIGHAGPPRHVPGAPQAPGTASPGGPGGPPPPRFAPGEPHPGGPPQGGRDQAGHGQVDHGQADGKGAGQVAGGGKVVGGKVVGGQVAGGGQATPPVHLTPEQRAAIKARQEAAARRRAAADAAAGKATNATVSPRGQ